MDASMAVAGPARRFVGRTGERTLLRHLLRDAAAGRPAIVVVSGVPGAGKSALLEWASDEAARLGARVLRASCYESSLPFAALGRLVAPFRELAEMVTTSRSTTGGAGPPDPTLGGATTSDLPRYLVDALVTRARRRPLAVLLDDVQDLGDASRTVLDDALAGLDDAGARQPLPLFVLLTARAPLDEGGLADRALRLRAARGVGLGGFDDRELAEFLTAAGRRPGRREVRDLIEQTGGLPLLVESQVQRWRSGPGPQDTPGPRHPGDDARVRSIADAVKLRFERVDDPARALLQQAAVLGEPWVPDELAVVAGCPAAEVAAVTDAAERARLVSRNGQVVRFAHPLVRSDLLDRLNPEQRAAMHRSTAERLRAYHAARGPIDDEAHVRIADHLLRAGPDVPPGEIEEAALGAGRIAMRWTAYDQAARFLSAAAGAAVGLHPDGLLAGRFLEAGRAAYYDYDEPLAESLFAQAIEFARRSGGDAVRLTAAMLLTRMRGGQRARPWDAIDVSELRDALRDCPGADVGVRVQAQAALAEALIGTGEGEAALRVLEPARAVATAVAPDPSIQDALARLDFTAGTQPMTTLDLDAADGLFSSALAHALEAGSTLTTTLAQSRRALVALLRGAVGRAHAELEDAEALAVTAGFWGEAGLAAALLAFAEVLAGRPGAADRVQQAHSRWSRTGNPWNAAILAALGPALAGRMAGPGGGGSAGTRAGDQSSAAMGLSPTALPAPSTFAALAAVEAHDVDGARRVVETARWRHGFRGPPTLNNTAVPTALVEVGDLLGDTAMVRDGAAALGQMHERGVMTTLPWPASVPRLLAVGARHGGDLAAARRHVDAALDLATREGLAPERAKCLLEVARVAAARGDRASSAEAMGAAVRAFDEQSMHGWIARCDEVGRELGLPPAVGSSGVIRERTILTNDVVGSTVSNARLGDVLYLEQLRVHDRLLRARLDEFRGVEIKHTGDGLNAVFDDRGDAMRCALAAMTDFRVWNEDEPELALQIRCGLAHGSLVPSGGDFFGLVQSEAARVCSLAGAGEVLATARVVEECPHGVTATSLGRHALRGLPSETEVFMLRSVMHSGSGP
ncbi:MAG TPA: AAA family ATPase [Acidimicrobiales bacterium]|nr:AAA family ATPase [Acidimicrobiales bacterium]